MTSNLAAENSVSEIEEPVTINEAFQQYVQQMPKQAKQLAQPEIAKFVRWIGPGRELSSINASEVGEYSEMQTARSQSLDAQERLSTVKRFLAYLRKNEKLVNDTK